MNPTMTTVQKISEEEYTGKRLKCGRPNAVGLTIER